MANLQQQFIDLVIRGKDLLSGESKQSEKALADLRKETKQTNQELRNLERQQGELSKAQSLSALLAQQTAELDKTRTATLDYAKSIDESKKKTKLQAAELQLLKVASNSAQRAVLATEKQLIKQVEALKQAGIDTNDLSQAQKKLAAQTSELESKLDGAKQSAKEYLAAAADDKKLATQARAVRDSIRAYAAYADELEKLDAPTSAQLRKLAQLQEQATAAANTFKGVSFSLGQHIAELDKAGKETDQLAASQQKLNKEFTSLSKQLADSNKKTQQISTATTTFGEVAQKTSGRISSLGKEIMLMASAYVGIQTLTSALGKFFGTAGQMEDFRYQMIGVFDSIEKGNDAYDWVVEFAKTVPPSLEDVMQSFIMLHNQGMNPMNGTLEKLIAANSKYGKGNATLVPIIRQLTQAWAKNRIQAEEVYVLVENGLPVWDMLSEATGKTVGQLQKMAEQGKLTRHELKKVIDIMGDRSLDAMNVRMGTFNSMLSKMQDRINQILDTIARSGALEYFKNEIDAIGDSIDKLSKTGELKVIAKDVSQGMIATAQAIKNVVVFIYEYAGAIKTLIGAMLALKAVNVFRSMVNELGPLITRTKTFGTLTLGLIPKIKVAYLALGAAVAWSATQFVALASAAHQWYQAEKAHDEALKRKTETQNELQKTLARYSAELGIVMNSMDDYERLLAEGVIYHDKLTAKLITAAEYQKRYGQEVSNTTAQMREGVSELKAQLESMADRGDSVNSIFKNLFSAIDTGNAGQILDLAEALALVEKQSLTTAQQVQNDLLGIEETGVLSAQQIAQGFTSALSTLSGGELLRFQQAARITMQNIGSESVGAAQVMEYAVSAALQKMGLDIQVVNNQFTTAGQDMVNTLEAIAQNASHSNESLHQATIAALGFAKTKTDFNQLSAKIAELGQRGLLTGQQVSDALLMIEGKLRDIDVAASKTEQAFQRLGLISLDSLQQQLRQTEADYQLVVAAQQQGEASAYQVSQAYLAWAEAVIKVAQANNEEIPITVAAQAAKLKLRTELNQLAQSYQNATGNGKKFERSLSKITVEANTLDRTLKTVTAAQQQSNATVDDSAISAANAAEKQGNLGQAMQHTGGMARTLTNHLNAIQQELTALSQATYDYYLSIRNTDMDRLSNQTRQATSEIARLEQEIGELSRTSMLGDSFQQWLSEVNLASARAELAFRKQSSASSALQRQLSNTDNVTQSLIDRAKRATRGFGLLDSTQLSGLRSAIKAAEQQLEQMTDSAENAVQTLRQELAGLNGDTVEQERLRLAQRRAELELQLSEARRSGNKDAVRELEKAIALFGEIERKTLDNAQKQVAEEKQREAEEKQREQEEKQREAEERQREQAQQQQDELDRVQREREERQREQEERRAKSEQESQQAEMEPPSAPMTSEANPNPTAAPLDAATARLGVVEVVQFNITINGQTAAVYATPANKNNVIDNLMMIKHLSM